MITEADILRAESQEYRDLVARAICGLKNLGRFESEPFNCLWGRVAHVFGLGSTDAIELCRRFGCDPDYDETKEHNE